MLREQGSHINSDTINAISADSVQRMKNAGAALQHSATSLLTPGSRPMGLKGSSWIIPKEIFKLSHRIAYIYRAKLQYKNKNRHHNKNLRKGVNKTDNYAINQVP